MLRSVPSATGVAERARSPCCAVLVSGDGPSAPLTLKDSPFWTLTPSYSQQIRIRHLRISAPMDRRCE